MTQLRIPHSLTSFPIAVWVRLFGEWATCLTANMIAPFLVLYLFDKLGGSVALTMLVVGLQPFAEIVFTLVAGGITDRFGRKPMMLAALLMQTTAMLGMAFADTVAAFALMNVVNGVGRSLFIPAGRAMLVDTVPADRRAEVFALLSTAENIGTTAGPLLGVWVYHHHPSFGFVCAALSLFLYALAVGWKVPETSPLGKTVPMEASGSAHSSADAAPRPLSSAGWVAARPALTLMLLALPVSLFYAQTETNLQLHFQDRFADPVSVLAWLTATKGILAIMLEYWLVRRTRQLPPERLVVCSYLCFGLVSLGYGFIESLPLLLCLQMVFVFAESVGLTQLLTLVSLCAPVHMRGWYFSLFGMHWDISRSFGPYLGSLLLLQCGGEVLFLSITIVLAGGAVAQHRYLTHVSRQLGHSSGP
ncbi:MAG: MFS transporter [Brevibacillus sp.]|nr:MFS transporter [Brevibacillus sp.]